MRYVQLVKMSFLCQISAIIFTSLLILSLLSHNVSAMPLLGTDQPNDIVKTTKDFQFSWQTSVGGVAYQFRASLNKADLADSQKDIADWTSTWLPTTELPFLDIPGASDGRWYWQVRSQDAAGTISDWGQIWQVTVDTTAPTITFTEPKTALMYGANSTIGLAASINDSCANERCRVKLDGVDVTGQLVMTRSNDETKIVGDMTTGMFDDGDHTVVVEATDEHGNKAEQALTFTVDATKPSVETSIENGRGVRGTVWLDFLVYDLHRESYRLSVTKDGDGAIPGLSEPTESEPGVYRYSWNTASLTKGMYRLAFTARDAAGNETVVVRTVEILPPSFELIGAATSDPLLEQLSLQLSRPFVSTQDIDSLPVVQSVAAITTSSALSLHPEFTKPATDQAGASAVVAPSENGWQIFGILWYWWLCITIISILMYRRLKVAQILIYRRVVRQQ